MIDPREFFGKFTQMVTGSVLLNDYCMSKYAKRLKVFLGMNLASPPDLEDAPFLVIYGVYKSVDLQRERTLIYSLDLALYVNQPNITTAGDVVTHDGIIEVEELRELFEEESKRQKWGRIDNLGNTDMEVVYPLFRVDFMYRYFLPESRR